MKIINRKEFLELPAGVIYAKCNSYAFGDLSIKGKSVANDWYYRSLLEIDSNDTMEMLEKIDRAREDGESFSLDLECECRDGFYDADQEFVVFEEMDARKLVLNLGLLLDSYPKV